MSLPSEAIPPVPQVSLETTACPEVEDVVLEGVTHPIPAEDDPLKVPSLGKGELARFINQLLDAYTNANLPLPDLSDGEEALCAALRQNPTQSEKQVAKTIGFARGSVPGHKQRALHKLFNNLPEDIQAYELRLLADARRLEQQIARYEITGYQDVTEAVRVLDKALVIARKTAEQYLAPDELDLLKTIRQNPDMDIQALSRLLVQDPAGLSKLSHRIIAGLAPRLPPWVERPRILDPSARAREVGRTLKSMIVHRAIAAIATHIEVDHNALLGFLMGQETPPAEEILHPLIRLLGLPVDQATEFRAQYEEGADYSYEPWVRFLSSLESEE